MERTFMPHLADADEIRYAIRLDIYWRFGVLVFPVSSNEKEELAFPSLVLRAWSLFDLGNVVLPLRRATFFNYLFFFSREIQLDRLLREVQSFKGSEKNLKHLGKYVEKFGTLLFARDVQQNNFLFFCVQYVYAYCCCLIFKNYKAFCYVNKKIILI